MFYLNKIRTVKLLFVFLLSSCFLQSNIEKKQMALTVILVKDVSDLADNFTIIEFKSKINLNQLIKDSIYQIPIRNLPDTAIFIIKSPGYNMIPEYEYFKKKTSDTLLVDIRSFWGKKLKY